MNKYLIGGIVFLSGAGIYNVVGGVREYYKSRKKIISEQVHCIVSEKEKFRNKLKVLERILELDSGFGTKLARKRFLDGCYDEEIEKQLSKKS